MLETVHCLEEEAEISTLSAVLNPLELSRYLCTVMPAGWGISGDMTVHVLEHHRGNRCTVDITLQTTTGKRELIGKVYAEDRPEVYRAMRHISQSGFGPEEEFSIPQPLSYVPEMHLLLQEKVQGPLAKEIFLHGSNQSRASAAERCARWLAQFHATEPQAERTFNLSDHLVSWQRWPQKIATLSRSLADKSYELLRQLQRAASALEGAEVCAGHGSYSHRQIILGESRTVTFDWDGYCLADPSRDVARFIIGLRRLALGRLGSIRALDAPATVFQRAYIAAAKPGSIARLPVYEAAICLELALRSLRKPRLVKFEALVNEGLRILKQHG